MLILWCMKCWSGEGIRATGFVFAIDGLVVNPRHACVARVTVVGLCVCVCVCVSVCLQALLAVAQSQVKPKTVLSVKFGAIIKGVFPKHVWFES